MNIELKNLLEEYGCKNQEAIKETIITECNVSILQLRDILLLLGEILYENLEQKIYVAKISHSSTTCTVAVKLSENVIYVVGYAKEGIIKQNICEKAFIYRINTKALLFLSRITYETIRLSYRSSIVLR